MCGGGLSQVKQREVSAHENLELRTRVVVQQQEVQQRGADARSVAQTDGRLVGWSVIMSSTRMLKRMITKG